ncbi:Cytochrome P450 3A4 [Tyrophagus putrescentiae]|nr:Cytochrome P450 3A4 [Tyrophagus putrescentiae]
MTTVEVADKPHNEARLKAEFAQRKVHYHKQPNAFFQVLRRERNDLHKQTEVIKKVGTVYGVKFLGSITICVSEPEIAQTVFSSEFTNFTNRRIFSLGDDLFFTKNIAAAQGEHWKRLRSVITPTFSAGKLRQMKPCMDDTVRTLLSNLEKCRQVSENVNCKRMYGCYTGWAKSSVTTFSKSDISLKIKVFIKTKNTLNIAIGKSGDRTFGPPCTMDSIVQVAFGLKIDSLTEKNHPVITNAHRLFSADFSIRNLLIVASLLLVPKIAKLLGLRFNGESIDYFSEFSTKILKDKRAAYTKEKEGKASNFIELMLEAEADLQNNNEHEKSKFITTEEITAQCCMFFIAGYDTSASAISMAVYQLAKHPQAQEKLYDEIVQMLAKLQEEAPPGSSLDPIDLISIDSLSRFPYLNAVLNESMRIYPPATFTERQASRDMLLQTADGRVSFEVKEGDVIQFPIFAMHHDANQFPEPDAFKPERFLNPTHHKYAFIPFGSGPRTHLNSFFKAKH